MSDKKRSNNEIIIIAMILVAIVYAVIQTLLGNNDDSAFKITLGVWIVLAVAVCDFFQPLCVHMLDGIGRKKITVYFWYSLIDMVTYTLLYIFVINVRMVQEPFHYGALVLAFVGMIVKSMLFAKFERMENIPFPEEFEDEDTDDDIFVNNSISSEEMKSILSRKKAPEAEDDFEVDTLEDEDDLKILIYRDRNKDK